MFAFAKMCVFCFFFFFHQRHSQNIQYQSSCSPVVEPISHAATAQRIKRALLRFPMPSPATRWSARLERALAGRPAYVEQEKKLLLFLYGLCWFVYCRPHLFLFFLFILTSANRLPVLQPSPADAEPIVVPVRRAVKRRLRSRNAFVDHFLGEEDGHDNYGDLEDFIVVTEPERRRKRRSRARSVDNT
jgi:hypothetical protein